MNITIILLPNYLFGYGEENIFAPSELIINADGSVFHLHLKPENLADKVILVGDPGRVALVASHFENIECEVSNREFRAITGTFRGKRITVLSTGIGCDNIDIVVNELDALANIDFKTRTEKETLRQLTFVRIGTCGGLQPYTPVGTYIASAKSIGFDGLLISMLVVIRLLTLRLKLSLRSRWDGTCRWVTLM